MAIGKMVTLGSVLEKYANDIVKNVKRNLMDDNLIASRRLYQSIRFNPIKVFGTRFTMEIVMEDYWKQVDQGQKPGTMPSVDSIVRWMQHKKIVPAQPRKRFGVIKSLSITGRLKRKLKVRALVDRRRQVAERIAKAIFRKGTIKRFGYRGSEFFSSYVDWSFEERLRESIREATGKDLKVQLIQDFTNIKNSK